MIKITQCEAEMLKNKGRGFDVHISSKTHKGRAKKYYMTESEESLDILSEYRKSILVKY